MRAVESGEVLRYPILFRHRSRLRAQGGQMLLGFGQPLENRGVGVSRSDPLTEPLPLLFETADRGFPSRCALRAVLFCSARSSA